MKEGTSGKRAQPNRKKEKTTALRLRDELSWGAEQMAWINRLKKKGESSRKKNMRKSCFRESKGLCLLAKKIGYTKRRPDEKTRRTERGKKKTPLSKGRGEIVLVALNWQPAYRKHTAHGLSTQEEEDSKKRKDEGFKEWSNGDGNMAICDGGYAYGY